ncbi:hypothetical protein [Nocardia farcinica]|uniref:Uncharacterized protein n=1 Tax=Nocardia farcinica (strain IFM 10152) TaxID=247156 RepID=Q5YZP0_NOCFA|nr:hypothetical protein [Nocardia farcinica]MBF6187625.1 hypothetical protein [Nocardia farcinica]BAD56351.1 hypothetical protein NFA_15060 [Nocardia farcinica IFM 10152]
MSSQANPRCQATTIDPRDDRAVAVWCELPSGHAGMHHADLRPEHPHLPLLTNVVPTLDWPNSEPAAEPGVWVVSGEYWGYDGPSQVVPYANEAEALRAANQESHLRAWFVPFGKDLREVMR